MVQAGSLRPSIAASSSLGGSRRETPSSSPRGEIGHASAAASCRESIVGGDHINATGGVRCSKGLYGVSTPATPNDRWGSARASAARSGTVQRGPAEAGPGDDRSEGTDQTLDPLVVRLERVLTEDGLALGVVELQVHPVHPVVLALEVGLADELAAQPGARGLGRLVLGPLDGLVVGHAVDHVLGDELVVQAAIGSDVVVLQVHERDLGVPPRQA